MVYKLRLCMCIFSQMSTETLQEYFETFGPVESCTIMRDAAGRSRCFAFLTFAAAGSVDKVMAQQHTLDGKVVSRLRS